MERKAKLENNLVKLLTILYFLVVKEVYFVEKNTDLNIKCTLFYTL